MKKNVTAGILLFMLAAGAADNGTVSFTASPNGGGIRDIMFHGRPLTVPGRTSFVERPHRSRGNVVTTEYFDDLSWKISEKSPLEMSATVRGNAAFENLEITKNFRLDRKKPLLFITYELKNMENKPVTFALWSKTFLRMPEKSLVSFKRNGKLFSTKGESSNIWEHDPEQRWFAIGDDSGKTGAVVTLPAEFASSFYSWFSAREPLSTAEWITCEIPLAPGETRRFEVIVEFTDNWKEKVDSLDLPRGKLPYSPSLWGREEKVKIDRPLFAPLPEGKNLIENGSFEEPSADGSAPRGFEAIMRAAQKRSPLSWEKGNAPDGSRMIRIEKKNSYHAIFSIDFPASSNKEYEVSCRISCDTPKSATSGVFLFFYDKSGKSLPFQGGKLFFSKSSYSWTTVARRIIAPEGAVSGRLSFRVLGMDQKMYLDDVKLICFDEVKGNRLEILRNRLQKGFYTPIDELEKLDASVETVHEKWFKPSSFEMPEVLFLANPVIGWALWDTEKRMIVELSQRMNLRYTYLPLLRRIMSNKSLFSVQESVYADELEEYSLELLRQIKNIPGAIWIQGIDFKKTQPELAEMLSHFQAGGAGIVFSNCQNIPQELTGKAIRLPASWNLLPVMGKGDLRKAIIPYEKKAVELRFGSMNQPQISQLPSVPDPLKGDTYFNPGGRDFPCMEYMYLPMLKALRWAAGDVPTLECVGVSGTMLTLASKHPETVILQTIFKDTFRHIEGKAMQKAELKAGMNSVSVQVPALPGGINIAEFKILNPEGKVIDAGAFRFDTPESVKPEIVFASADRCFEPGKMIEFTVGAPGADSVEAEIEDSSGRIVFREKCALNGEKRFAAALHAPYTTLYHLYVKVFSGDHFIARKSAEFSIPFPGFDFKDVHALGNAYWRGAFLLPEWGFDLAIANCNVNRGYFRMCTQLGLNVIPRGCGDEPRDRKNVYRGDIPSDPVRNPCYSSPEWQKKQTSQVASLARKDNYRYYGIVRSMLGDEVFLGSSVCYSQYCLEAFRKALKNTYRTLEALNRQWGCSFKNWDEVVPCQLSELPSHDNLSRWLDHKMFMTEVYADSWAGTTAEALRSVDPAAGVGLSGSQEPGYSYDWDFLMRHMKFLGYYGGIQGKLSIDFGNPDLLTGQCAYPGYLPQEAGISNTLWGNLFKGANLSYMYYGAGFNGDLTLNLAARFYVEKLHELKNGVGKLILEAKETPEIALLYSQRSMFCALAAGDRSRWLGAQTGWAALLDDLHYSYRFVRNCKDNLSGIKVLILPMTFSLSDEEIVDIRRFEAKGGKVLGDVDTGLFDGHGKRRQVPLSGITVLGKPIDRYRRIESGGVGGEIETVKNGNGDEAQMLRNKVGTLFDAWKVEPDCMLQFKGAAVLVKTILRNDHGNRVFGIYVPAVGERLDPSKKVPMEVKLMRKGHVFEIFSGKYFGCTDQFSVSPSPGFPMVFSIQDARPEAVRLSLPETVEAGKSFEAGFSVPNASGPQIFHVEVLNPAGKSLRIFRKNFRTEGGEGRFTIPVAWNDPPGKWTVELTHVNTGAKATGTFRCLPNHDFLTGTIDRALQSHDSKAGKDANKK